MTLSPLSTLQQIDRHEGKPSATAGLMQAARDVLLQGLELLFELNDRTYSERVNISFVTTIGEQYRTTLERFQAVVRGLRTGEIRYGNREKNSRLQEDVAYASVATCDILRALKGYTNETLLKECRVTTDAVDDASAVDSKIASEVAHCIERALQHYAIIHLLCLELGITTPSEFGEVPTGTFGFEFTGGN